MLIHPNPNNQIIKAAAEIHGVDIQEANAVSLLKEASKWVRAFTGVRVDRNDCVSYVLGALMRIDVSKAENPAAYLQLRAKDEVRRRVFAAYNAGGLDVFLPLLTRAGIEYTDVDGMLASVEFQAYCLKRRRNPESTAQAIADAFSHESGQEVLENAASVSDETASVDLLHGLANSVPADLLDFVVLVANGSSVSEAGRACHMSKAQTDTAVRNLAKNAAFRGVLA